MPMGHGHEPWETKAELTPQLFRAHPTSKINPYPLVGPDTGKTDAEVAPGVGRRH